MYHAEAMFGSPLLVGILAAGVRAMREAGIEQKERHGAAGTNGCCDVANVQRQGLPRASAVRWRAETQQPSHCIVRHCPGIHWWHKTYLAFARVAARICRWAIAVRLKRHWNDSLRIGEDGSRCFSRRRSGTQCYPSSIVPHTSQLFLDYTESTEPLTPFFPLSREANAGYLKDVS